MGERWAGSDMDEATWSRQFVELARMCGFKRLYHTYRSKKSPTGFPDWVLVRERVLFCELKRDGKDSKPSLTQAEWLADLLQAGAETYLLRPRHLQLIASVLRARGPVGTWNADQREARVQLLLDLEADLANHLERAA